MGRIWDWANKDNTWKSTSGFSNWQSAEAGKNSMKGADKSDFKKSKGGKTPSAADTRRFNNIAKKREKGQPLSGDDKRFLKSRGFKA